MKKLVLFCLVFSVGVGLYAQQAAPGSAASAAPAASSPPPVLPPGPLLKPVPDKIRWTLTSASKRPEAATPGASPGQGSETGKPGEKEKAKGTTTAMVGERMGKMAHVLTVRADGSREEKWTDGTLLAIMHARANAPVFTTERIETMPTPTWISRDNFTDIKQQGDKSFLIFRTRILPSGLEIVRDLEAEALGHAQDTESLKVDAIAVIDADTRLPVAVTEGDITTTYKFEPLAPDAQIIPAAIQADLATREKKLQDLVRKPVRP